jgi:hypothetical protein
MQQHLFQHPWKSGKIALADAEVNEIAVSATHLIVTRKTDNTTFRYARKDGSLPQSHSDWVIVEATFGKKTQQN